MLETVMIHGKDERSQINVPRSESLRSRHSKRTFRTIERWRETSLSRCEVLRRLRCCTVDRAPVLHPRLTCLLQNARNWDMQSQGGNLRTLKCILGQESYFHQLYQIFKWRAAEVCFLPARASEHSAPQGHLVPEGGVGLLASGGIRLASFGSAIR
ncbi:UNVERIFIED_CONTAM: hypothetical protein HHA_451990 [Hammondia hammondi]|eukprot:XP_008884972.1 hypothetical protein HHA_451990 [Hammondia hammondi]